MKRVKRTIKTEITEAFCTECEKNVKVNVDFRKNVQRLIGGKLITGNLIVCHCAECGALVSIPEYEHSNDKEFFGKYRQECGLLQPEDIKQIREKYKLSQANFAKLLGMGEKTITRYENGSVQDEAHDTLIRAAQNIKFVKQLYELRKFDFEISIPNSIDSTPWAELRKTTSSYQPKPGIYTQSFPPNSNYYNGSNFCKICANQCI